MDANDLLTVDELSQLLKVKKSWIYRCTHEGRLPVVRISSRCIRFRRSEIERWLRKKTSQATEPRGTEEHPAPGAVKTPSSEAS